MANLITEVTSTSIFGRIGNSFVGMLFGFVLVVGSVILLFWNEGRAVATAKSLKEGAATVIDVPSDSIDPANDSKLIHVTGDTAAGDKLEDPLFNISESALRLRRNITVYEWKEKKESKSRDKVGGGKETTTTYSYEKVWATELIKSSSFKSPEDHRNPVKLEIPGKEFVSKNATLGQFKLTPEIIGKIRAEESLAATDERLAKVPSDLQAKLKVESDQFYLGSDPANPEIGDEKISFAVLRPGTIERTRDRAGRVWQCDGAADVRARPGRQSHADLDSARRGFRGDVHRRVARARTDLRLRARDSVPGLTRGSRFRHCVVFHFRDRFHAGNRGGVDRLPAARGRVAAGGGDRFHRAAKKAPRQTSDGQLEAAFRLFCPTSCDAEEILTLFRMSSD